MKYLKSFENLSESSSKELSIGIKIESEHCDIYDELDKWLEKTHGDSMPWTRETFYKKIAESHIKEIPDYYTRLVKMENEYKK